MNEHINIAQNVPKGARLYSAVDTLNATRQRFKSLEGIMGSTAMGGDWAAFATEFGLPAGEGETVYNLVTGAIAALDTFAVLTTINRLG